LLPRQTARAVLQLAPEHRAGAAVVFDRVHADQVIYEKIDWEDPRRKAYFAKNREFLAQVCPLEDCLIEDPIQVMYSGSVSEMQQVTSALRAAPEALEFSLAMTFYDRRDFAMVDAIRLNCSKGATLAEWTALRGFEREEVMAIGDNFNDREMLEFAGLPIVMANSVPELKLLGWRQTLSNDEGGVAAAIRQYALENI
jgi:hydroxymethylpyrimidine pyrophosphatase-like HAD family hydrolase